MKEIQYIYHIIPKDLKGTVLHPLNDLATIDKELYDSCIKKYEGREHLLDRIIPLINLKWNDVIFFSSINPDLIIDCLREIGFKHDYFNYIKIPVTDLDYSKTVAYHYLNVSNKDYSPEDEYSMLTDYDYKELKKIPEETKKYFEECFSNQRNPKLFVGIEHILLADSFDISKYIK